MLTSRLRAVPGWRTGHPAAFSGDPTGSAAGSCDVFAYHAIRFSRAMLGQCRGRDDWIDGLLISVLVTLSVAHAWVYRFETIDDAYITYRYAENIVAGHGFVYNPGERVEGTSTFLFTLMLAGGRWLGFDIELSSRWISVAAFASLVWLVYGYVRATSDARISRILAFASALVVASSTALAFYAALGMELTVFITLLTAGLFACLRNMEDARMGRHFMLALALAAATRTEGMAVALLTLGWCTLHWALGWHTLRQSDPITLRNLEQRVKWALLWLAAVLVPLYVFRWWYFGALIPNSVLAKSGTFGEFCQQPLLIAAAKVWRGSAMAMLRDFADGRLGLIAVVLPLGWLSSRYRRQTTLFAAVCLLMTGVVLWNDGDWMPHSRLLAPTIPLLAVALAASVSTLGHLLRHARSQHWLQVSVAIGLFAYSLDHFWYERTLSRARSATTEYMCYLGKALALTRSPAELLATDMAGRVPYFSQLRTLDVFGLNDAHIARFGRPLLHMGKTDFAYVYPKRPDYYFYNIRKNIRYMYDNENFRPYVNDYWLVMTPFFRAQNGACGKVLLVRKDLARLGELLRLLHATTMDPNEYK